MEEIQAIVFIIAFAQVYLKKSNDILDHVWNEVQRAPMPNETIHEERYKCTHFKGHRILSKTGRFIV